MPAGESLSLTRRRIDGCFVVSQGTLQIRTESSEYSVSEGRIVGLHNLVSCSVSDTAVLGDDSELTFNITAVTDSVLMRLTRTDVLMYMGNAFAPLAAISNWDACTALLAAFSNELRVREAGGSAAREDLTLFDVATASILTRYRKFLSIIDANIQLDPSKASSLTSCITWCDFFAQRMLALSPTGAPLLAPPPFLLVVLREIIIKYLHPAATAAPVRDSIPDDVRNAVLLLSSVVEAGSHESGSDVSDIKLQPAVLPCSLLADVLGSLDFLLSPIIQDFRASTALRQSIEMVLSSGSFLDVDAQLLSDAVLKAGAIARFQASKLNRYSRWQDRVLIVRLDTADVQVLETASEASSRFRLTSVAGIERVSSDPTSKQLRMHFSAEVERDYQLRFEDTGMTPTHPSSSQNALRTLRHAPVAFCLALPHRLTPRAATRETFCTLIHLLNPAIPITEDSIHVNGPGCIAYEVCPPSTVPWTRMHACSCHALACTCTVRVVNAAGAHDYAHLKDSAHAGIGRLQAPPFAVPGRGGGVDGGTRHLDCFEGVWAPAA
ncbi:hypothetical protein EON66_02375 [archaeon]|nr:MAG: hypothetical protein EON66_02375 [archaeon]